MTFIYFEFLFILYCLTCIKGQTFDYDVSNVRCSTTKGSLEIEVYHDWAPIGAKRFLDLVRDGFFTNISMFRTVENFLTQFGISDDPKYKYTDPNNKFKEIPDDKDLKLGIKKHYISFAGSGRNSRSTQLFIAFEDLDFLGPRLDAKGKVDGSWETPLGKVINGDKVLDSLYKGYGEKPNQGKLHQLGNKYIHENFPLLDFIIDCQILDTKYDSREAHEFGAHNAAASGDLRKLEHIHKLNPLSIHTTDINKWQPLHEAVRSGNLETVRFLVEKGVDLGAKTKNGGTALWWAKRSLPEDHSVISFLRTHGAPEEGDL